MWRGKLLSGVSVLWDEVLATDLTERVTELALPAYFFHGIYDYTVNYKLAKGYSERLKAPLPRGGVNEVGDHAPAAGAVTTNLRRVW